MAAKATIECTLCEHSIVMNQSFCRGIRMSQEEQTIKLDQRDVLDAAMTAGHILLENGAEIFRVEETIDRICHHFGVQSENAFVLSNGIFLTSGDEHEKRFARVEHIPVRGAQLHRVAAVNQLSREIEEGKYTLPEIREKLEQIRNAPGASKRALGADVRSWQRLFFV